MIDSKYSSNFILFNIGGSLAVLVVGAYFVRSLLFPETAPPCSKTYATVVELPYERSDRGPISAAELQARLAGREFGVIENARPIQVSGAPHAVLEVKLPKGSITPRTTSATPGGISFQWRPRGIESATAACLSYAVWLPEDFDFKRGGTLPGLFGSVENNRGEERTAFAVRYMWRDVGALEVLTTLPQAGGEPRTTSFDSDFLRLPRGRWVSLEQEVVLNAPGSKDGAIRVWVNGQLFVDRQQLSLRESNTVGFSGVQADAHYGGSDPSFGAPKDTVLHLSPFQVRMR